MAYWNALFDRSHAAFWQQRTFKRDRLPGFVQPQIRSDPAVRHRLEISLHTADGERILKVEMLGVLMKDGGEVAVEGEVVAKEDAEPERECAKTAQNSGPLANTPESVKTLFSD